MWQFPHFICIALQRTGWEDQTIFPSVLQAWLLLGSEDIKRSGGVLKAVPIPSIQEEFEHRVGTEASREGMYLRGKGPEQTHSVMKVSQRLFSRPWDLGIDVLIHCGGQ